MTDGLTVTMDTLDRFASAAHWVEQQQRSAAPSAPTTATNVKPDDWVVIRQRDPLGMGHWIEVQQVAKVKDSDPPEWVFVVPTGRPAITPIRCWPQHRVRHYAELAQPTGDTILPGTHIIGAELKGGEWWLPQVFRYGTPYPDEIPARTDCGPRFH